MSLIRATLTRALPRSSCLPRAINPRHGQSARNTFHVTQTSVSSLAVPPPSPRKPRTRKCASSATSTPPSPQRRRPLSIFSISDSPTRRMRKRRGNLHLADKITVHEVVGRGAYGTVSRGVDRHGRQVAVKSIPRGETDEDSASLKLEVDMLQRVKSDRVLDVLDIVDTGDDAVHVVSELHPGGDMLEVIMDHGAEISEHQVKRMTKEMLESVKACHDADVLHLDVKPENYVLRKKLVPGEAPPNLVLVDFGSAHPGPPAGSAPTAEVEVRDHEVGTEIYTAPEVVQTGRASRKSDAWSAGVTAYIMLTQSMPWSEGEEYRHRRHVGEFEKRTRKYRALPGQAKDFIGRLIDPQPETRMSVEEALAHPYLASV